MKLKNTNAKLIYPFCAFSFAFLAFICHLNFGFWH